MLNLAMNFIINSFMSLGHHYCDLDNSGDHNICKLEAPLDLNICTR